MTTNKLAIPHHIAELYEALLRSHILTQLGNLSPETKPMSEHDLAKLLEFASRQSILGDPYCERLAYDIATKVLQTLERPSSSMVTAVNLILSRLGNFPGIDLIDDRYSSSNKLVYPFLLALEKSVRKRENTYAISTTTSVTLTDFQIKLLDAVDRSNSVSFSAPTSAGKSFALGIDIIRRLQRNKNTTIAFIVPTRALIQQVMSDVIDNLRSFDLSQAKVLCVPEVVPRDQAREGVIYVLTQERFINLLSIESSELQLNVLVIDEAQEIEEGGRGLLLQTAVEVALGRFPNTQILFSSPMRSNPGYLLHLFKRDTDGTFFTEANSPVSQNLILLSPVKNKPKELRVDLFKDDSYINVAVIDLPFNFRPPKIRLQANIAYALTLPGDSSILYANGAAEAEDLASELASLLPIPDELDQSILDFIDFLSENVHENYSLINVLKQGIAFHYGQMPHIVRNRIEELFKEQKIKFLCCTSTLLQGVNLPAKNIFIYHPRKGKGTAMDGGAFWNLAGRAGRLKKEFQGNVWCISKQDWAVDPFHGEKFSKIESALQKGLNSNRNIIIDAIRDSNRPSESRENSFGDQAFAKLFSDYTLNGRHIHEIEDVSQDALSDLLVIDELCKEVLKESTIPAEIYKKNSNISPHRLEELAESMRQALIPESLLALSPYQPGGLERIRQIFRVVSRVFLKEENESYRYYSGLAYQWLTGETLVELIQSKLRYENIPDEPKKISAAIRNLLDELETGLRYKYVKYLKAYLDILSYHVTNIGRSDLTMRIYPLHLYIEYGSAQKTLIELMALGVSRTTAILLKRALHLGTSLSRDDCQEIINRVNLEELIIPQICKLELSKLRRK
jgi:superfamily II DNA/RNA helicase